MKTRSDSGYTGPTSSKTSAKKKTTTSSVDKSKWNTNVKVSQATIDQIKKMGMSKALGSVAGASKSKGDASAKQFVEGVRRLYGASRVESAIGKSAPTTKKQGFTKSAVKEPGKGPAARIAKKVASAKPSATPRMVAQKDIYGNKAGAGVVIKPGTTNKTTPKKKAAYKSPIQKDMYGNRIK